MEDNSYQPLVYDIFYKPSLQEIDPQYASLYDLHDNAALPDEAYRFDPICNAQVAQLPKLVDEDRMFLCGKYIQRLIFYGGQDWDAWEKEHLEKFKAFLKGSNLELPKHVKLEEILRNLQASQFNYKLTYQNILKTIEWRKDSIPIKLNSTVEELIRSGFLYVYGRDRNMRPLIIIRPRIIAHSPTSPEDGLMAISFMMEYTRTNFFLPGQIENWILMIDLDKLSLKEVPYKKLKVFMSTLQSQYRCTSSKIFILNSNTFFNIIWATIRTFLEEHTKQKITLTKAGTCPQLLSLFAPQQLQKRYGGEAPDFEGPWWPPQMPCNDFGVEEQKIVPQEKYEEYFASRINLKRSPHSIRRNEPMNSKLVTFSPDNQSALLVEECKVMLLNPKEGPGISLQQEDELKLSPTFEGKQGNSLLAQGASQRSQGINEEDFKIAELESTRLSRLGAQYDSNCLASKAIASVSKPEQIRRKTHKAKKQDKPLNSKDVDKSGEPLIHDQDGSFDEEESKQVDQKSEQIHQSSFAQSERQFAGFESVSPRDVRVSVIEKGDEIKLCSEKKLSLQTAQFEANLSNRFADQEEGGAGSIQKQIQEDAVGQSKGKPLNSIKTDQVRKAQGHDKQTPSSSSAASTSTHDSNSQKGKAATKACCVTF